MAHDTVSVALTRQLLLGLQAAQPADRPARGPFLSELLLEACQLQLSNGKRGTDGSSADPAERFTALLKAYIDAFSHKLCCFMDIAGFLVPYVQPADASTADDEATIATLGEPCATDAPYEPLRVGDTVPPLTFAVSQPQRDALVAHLDWFLLEHTVPATLTSLADLEASVDTAVASDADADGGGAAKKPMAPEVLKALRHHQATLRRYTCGRQLQYCLDGAQLSNEDALNRASACVEEWQRTQWLNAGEGGQRVSAGLCDLPIANLAHQCGPMAP